MKTKSLIAPPFLKPGNKIGIAAPARAIEKKDIDNIASVLHSWDIEIVYGKYLFEKENQFAGNDLQRAESFQQLLDDTSVNAIIFARGGYGSVRTLQHLNFNQFIKKPKWLVGFSDITVFHSYVNTNLGIQTLHAPMVFNTQPERLDIGSWEYLKKALFGELNEYLLGPHFLNQSGEATGILMGGNLSVLYSLRGTSADLHTDDAILFLEDIDEYLYHIDRMMMNLKLGGKLEKLSGLIIGSFSDMKDNLVPFGKNAYEIIGEYSRPYNYPVCMGFPAGHEIKNLPLFLGRQVRLIINKRGCTLNFL